MFEVGTGRGTACYMVSLSPSIGEIQTVDILRKDEQRKTAIGYRAVWASNLDIYNKIPIDTKSKIEMLHRSETAKLKSFDFDLVFIDGDHSNKNIILEDFEIGKKHSNENTIFVFDDYDPVKFAVKGVVDQILNTEKYYSYLVSFRGHLFRGKEKEQNSGMVILSKKELF